MNGSLTNTTVSSNGTTIEISNCSPLRRVSRSSIAVWAASIRPRGAAPGRGAKAPGVGPVKTAAPDR